MQSSILDVPVRLLNVPAGHEMSWYEPAGQYEPVGHVEGKPYVKRQYEPAGH